MSETTNTENQGSAEAQKPEEHFTILNSDRQCPFSNGHRVAFGLNGLKYNCVDQFIQHQKAGESFT